MNQARTRRRTSTVLELKEAGFAFAVVVLIDAALTRRLLVPAALLLARGRVWRHRVAQPFGI